MTQQPTDHLSLVAFLYSCRSVRLEQTEVGSGTVSVANYVFDKFDGENNILQFKVLGLSQVEFKVGSNGRPLKFFEDRFERYLGAIKQAFYYTKTPWAAWKKTLEDWDTILADVFAQDLNFEINRLASVG